MIEPRGVVVWLTGLPQSGKSTLARRARAALDAPSAILDSDEIRAALVPERGYGAAERDDFYASLANLAGVLADQGLVVLVAATASRRMFRERARARAPRFIEVHVDASVETCRARDIKGLYDGDTTELPGSGVAYDRPEAPDVHASGGHDDEALSALLAAIRAGSATPG